MAPARSPNQPSPPCHERAGRRRPATSALARIVGGVSTSPADHNDVSFEVTGAGGVMHAPARGSVMRVGRSDDNDIVLDAEPTVSRHHAEFVVDGEDWSVRDLSSHNGTFVNGVRLDGVAAMPVTPSDVVTLGDVTIRLVGRARP